MKKRTIVSDNFGNVRDIRGERFGRLVVPQDAEYEIRGTHAYWQVVCDCSEGMRRRPRKWVRGSKLTSKRVVSCGCARADEHVRRAARWKTPAAERVAIAKQGAQARWLDDRKKTAKEMFKKVVLKKGPARDTGTAAKKKGRAA